MSLRSIKVTAVQHLVQRVLQGLVWSKKGLGSKTKHTLTLKGEANTYKSSLPQPCPDLRAAPTGVAMPARIGQSTCK